MFKQVRKRDGAIVPFDQDRITAAILKAMTAASEGEMKEAKKVSDRVLKELLKKYLPKQILGIEQIQDVVEEILILEEYSKTAKAYILYRRERAELREKRREIPSRVKKLVEESKKYFRNPLSEFIYYRSYSRWIEEEGRRETWIESVQRYVNFMKENLGDKLKDEEYQEIQEAILKQEVMPSMRLLWASGKAARATNVCAYNCSFIAPSKLRDFGEIMYLSMCGTGVGFSVEQQNVQKLPQIKKQIGKKIAIHVIEDSKEGWAEAFILALKTWFDGKDIELDYSQLRPVGARLKVMGGRSSGPGPLRELLEFSKIKILAKQGRRLDTIDVHDIICKIGEIVVSGGVRRSALISLSDVDDEKMRLAKTGQFYLTEPQRSMANNSAAYNEKPAASLFLDEWITLAKSGTGERGIFNRGSLKNQLPKRRWKVFAKDAVNCGTNPCGEIVLKSKQFCNLSEVVARVEDKEEDLLRKVRLATILGTYQSTLIAFPFLSKEWKENCEEERLLGVSVTGQWDCPEVRKSEALINLKEEAIKVNKIYAQRFGINQSTAITCVKPSGTVSQLVDASSGLHPRHGKYYIRRVRISAADPLFHMLR
ncbi:MAG: ribonucleoside-triphosphate reductase, partial [Parcubacteria group bacterium RIFCSPHIGHO2_01_FULL_40_30]